jgi:hypothetical protein
MNNFPTPEELAREAIEALRSSPMTPSEHFEFLVRRGIIDRNGRVLVNKLFGENHADTQSDDSPPNGTSVKPEANPAGGGAP